MKWVASTVIFNQLWCARTMRKAPYRMSVARWDPNNSGSVITRAAWGSLVVYIRNSFSFVTNTRLLVASSNCTMSLRSFGSSFLPSLKVVASTAVQCALNSCPEPSRKARQNRSCSLFDSNLKRILPCEGLVSRKNGARHPRNQAEIWFRDALILSLPFPTFDLILDIASENDLSSVALSFW